MKSVTIENVKARIAELEKIASHGELSLRGEFELACLRQLVAAMDSEPVILYRERNPYNGLTTGWQELTENELLFLKENAGENAEFLKLYRHAQPAKGLELAGWQFKSVNGDWLGLIDEHGKNQAVREGCEVREVFAMADGINERDQVRSEHAEWSQATFGNVGPVGPLKHLSKEALEAAAEPDDLSEWADMQFLLWDAQRRAGITDERITQAMIEKLAVNKQREWPEPKDGEPRLHIKAQPAPEAMPECFRNAVSALESLYRNGQKQCWNDRYTTDMAYASVVLNACRAAMLQAGNEPPATDNTAQTDTLERFYAWCVRESASPGDWKHLAWMAVDRYREITAPEPDQPENDNTAQQFEALATSTKCKRCDGEGWVADEMGITQCGCGATTSAGKVKS